MATLTDDEYGAQLVENALTRSKAAKIAMVHLCECWEIDGTLGILRVRLRDGIDMEWFRNNFVPAGVLVEDLNCRCLAAT
jgi:hypothetical protein